MLLRVTSAPATEPVTYTEAKAHLRLEHDLDQTYVTTLITAAREHVEEICSRGLISQTWEATLDAFPCGAEIELPKGPLISITSVIYVDENGTNQTLATTEYAADTLSVPGKVRLKYGKSWPGTRDQWDAVKVTYVVGWATASAVPAAIKQAMLLLISQMYEHRTPEIVGTIVSPVKFAVDALLIPYRLVRY